MAEVEAETIGFDERSFLGDVRAKHIAQRRMQQVRRRVIGANLLAALMVDFELGPVADLDRALGQAPDMRMQAAGLLQRVIDREFGAVRKPDDAMIASLTAAFGVKGRAVEHERARLALRHGMAFLAVRDDRGERPFAVLSAIAEEFIAARALKDRMPDGGIVSAFITHPAFAAFLALTLHRLVESGGIHFEPAPAQNVLREIERKAKRIVKLERGFAGELLALLQAGEFVIEQLQAIGERASESIFFFVQLRLDNRFGATEFRIGLAHLGD